MCNLTKKFILEYFWIDGKLQSDCKLFQRQWFDEKFNPKVKLFSLFIEDIFDLTEKFKSAKNLRAKCISHPHQVPQQDVVVVDGETLAFLDVS